MSDNKHIGYGVAAGVCFFTAVLAHDFKSDNFNMVDYFNVQTENAYTALFISCAAIGGIGGGGLGATAEKVRRSRPTAPSQNSYGIST